MLGDIVYKLVSVLMPEDVRELKAAGMVELAKAFLVQLEWMVRVAARRCQGVEKTDSEVGADIYVKLNELEVALHEG